VRLSVILLVACGSAPPPQPVITPATPPKPPAAVSCGDAGVMLRGSVKDPKKAGPAKEAAIASACLFDKWAREVLDCIGSTTDRQACLDKLTEPQRVALTKKLTVWADAYAESLVAKEPDAGGEEPEVDPP
jgi:hypothetical protein